MENCHQQLAKKVQWKTVTNAGRRMSFQMFRYTSFGYYYTWALGHNNHDDYDDQDDHSDHDDHDDHDNQYEH